LIDLDIRITDSLLDGLIERGFLKHYERNTPRAVRKAIMDMLLVAWRQDIRLTEPQAEPPTPYVLYRAVLRRTAAWGPRSREGEAPQAPRPLCPSHASGRAISFCGAQFVNSIGDWVTGRC
jgi:hypothetical protein